MSKIIDLLPHNNALYQEITKHIAAGETSIFYSEATGLGKSFIFMRLVQEYFEGKRILYIVPKVAIFDNLTHYKEFEYLNAVIDMKGFASFNEYSSDSYMLDVYDVVFVDECHHMLSDIQGDNVHKFLTDMNSRGKLTFGFTATPYYGGEFVDEKYFDVSCYGYDVFEAIEEGLMPKIDVALANVDLSEVPSDMRASYSITGTKTVLEAILEQYGYITHWLAYFTTKSDLERNVAEMQKLFPDFKILKIYQGVHNVEDIIKEFEESEGKVVLMSVSMLLEGMHLSNVGGVLLYRNVTRHTTYFQIYGRLCKLFSKSAPVLVDITNSALQLSDFPVFKSNRCSNRKQYSKKDIFDTHSYGYRLIELQEMINQFKMKEYRGVRWTTVASLANVLHVKPRNAVVYIKRPGRTEESYIDYVLKDSTYEQFVQDGYVGYYVCGSYKYRDFKHLKELLGAKTDYVLYCVKHPNATVQEYIDGITSYMVNKEAAKVVYRGVDMRTHGTIGKYFGVNDGTVSGYMTAYNLTKEQYVDLRLDHPELFYVKKSPDNIIIYYKGVDITTEETIAAHFDVTTKHVREYMYRKKCSKKDYVDAKLTNPHRFYARNNTPKYMYRGVDIRQFKTIGKYFNVRPGTVSLYIRSHNITKEEYVDLRFDHPEKFKIGGRK